MNLSTKQKQLRGYREQICGCQGGGGESGIDRDFDHWYRCKLSHLEWISNEVLLYITGNYIQSLGIDHDGRYYEKKNVSVCMSGHYAVQQKLTQHCKSTIL